MTSKPQSDSSPPGEKKSPFAEYAVIAALILVVIIGAITLLGERFSGQKPAPAATQTAQ